MWKRIRNIFGGNSQDLSEANPSVLIQRAIQNYKKYIHN